MSIVKKTALAALLAPALMAGVTYAAEPGFYLGASGGQSFIDDEINETNIDDDDTGWKAFLGYQFVPWLGVEAGYVDFGSFSSDDLFENTNFGADIDASGWEGFLVGSIPIGAVDLFAKVGAIDLKTELDTQNFGSEDDNDTQLAYGAGVAYNMGHWGLRLEAEGYDDNEVDDFYFVSAGVTYRFFQDKAEPVAASPVPAAPAECPDADSDGVCDSADQCPNTPRAVRVDSKGCDCDYTLQLQFAFDSAKLSPTDMAELDKLASSVKDANMSSITGVVDGYADSVGAESYNLGLSKRRAQAVANYLQSQGVNLGSGFSVNGYGEAEPVASNETAEGRAQNRRVVVRRTDCGPST